MQTEILVTIQKWGAEKIQPYFKPIVVMSYARKVVKTAVAIEAWKHYKFHKPQLGFQEGTSNETAIIRHITTTQGMKIKAVLDLKSAHDKIPRNLMKDLEKKKLAQHLQEMIAAKLHRLNLVTKGDHTEAIVEIPKGTTEGSLPRPMLPASTWKNTLTLSQRQ